MTRLTTLIALAAFLLGCSQPLHVETLQWQPLDIELTSAEEHPWFEFPARAELQHESGAIVEIPIFWSRPRQYTLRFTPALPGHWEYRVTSGDAGLDGAAGSIEVTAPDDDQITANPNLRGQLQISPNGRHFTYADGTPFFLLADTIWAGNTARAGLGDNQDGPFFQYLADRREKGFTTVLMQMFHGFGDYPDDPTGHANEGGHLFVDQDFARLNPDFLNATDARWQALWERGWAVASPFSWWGKTQQCRFSAQQAQQLAGYFAARYGSFNAIWAVSGEYQYVYRDCGWTDEDLDAIGRAIQIQNPYERPLSIHPSGRVDWDPPHHVQSSLPFHDAQWLDHHWLQTGQSIDRMYNLASRPAENSALEPPKPVFCSEAYYENARDPDGAYHSRWQAWTAFLSGCAGYGYGAQGVWQFRDPDAAEPGKDVRNPPRWGEAMAFAGSADVGYVRAALQPLDWPRLEPAPNRLLVNGAPAAQPTSSDITPPQAASIDRETWVVYIPRGNASRSIAIDGLQPGAYAATWHDPRTGATQSSNLTVSEPWTIPARPDPADEDWALVLARDASR